MGMEKFHHAERPLLTVKMSGQDPSMKVSVSGTPAAPETSERPPTYFSKTHWLYLAQNKQPLPRETSTVVLAEEKEI